MESPKSFAEIWAEAHRERSEYVWSIISRMMATPRRPAPAPQPPRAPEAAAAPSGSVMLPMLALFASFAMTIGAMTQGQAGPLDQVCALKEVTVITLIDDHGAAEDLPADRVSNAAVTMLRARSICYEGRVSEALALYESILSLGPVATLHRQ